MKLEPRHSQIIGRMTIKRSDSKIILTNDTKVTKLILVDAVGPGAAAAGVKVGDVVIAKLLNNMVFDGGKCFRPLVEEKDIACFVTDLQPNELLVQREDGTQYVSFESPEAAESIGASPVERAVEAA